MEIVLSLLKYPVAPPECISHIKKCYASCEGKKHQA